MTQADVRSSQGRSRSRTVARAKNESANPIDSLMERASRALVRCHYFEAERLCLEGLRAAHAAWDYERMTRVLLPLEEARRQKRDLAFDAGQIAVVDEGVPEEKAIAPGCYLVCPPRVGLDGRSLRESADRAEVPVIVVVREPTTREGLWPIVALGPVTIRTKVPPPVKAGATRRGGVEAGKHKTVKRAPKPVTNGHGWVEGTTPSRTWFLKANERLGDAAIASVDPTMEPFARVDALMKRLEAHPDHEKLHQALGDACRSCLAHIAVHGRPKRPAGEVDPGRGKSEGYDADL